ncbi:putative kinesin [Leishmania infantum JPCM5]|uniref:Kinesin_-_putative n=2 Tax=Leishmania infantum TaxID=5671 RepID=A0A6L0XYZ5_LEIIN|nr:putative kinesin [Leishmania infantum JPCM5]CAC9538084.1 kinesin_-_putative [Leishmania infantum]CAM71619.1 putative kinesin [Leishmania infantum JPCM5]SUZ45533.1 kinesin_-_putative [Leishmania infantum]|eukprot:XP_001468535.1 putative kinesin [Leishmania infantum JPCM5]
MGNDDNRGDSQSPPPRTRQVAWKPPDVSASPIHLSTPSAHRDPIASSGAFATEEAVKEGERCFGRIRVVVRCRPLQPDTEADHSTECVRIKGDEVIVCDKAMQKEGRCYRFDRVLPAEADQVTTFAEIAPLVEHVLDGFHATVFAYGQTGSGKTHTMDGLRYASNSQQRKAIVPDVDGTEVQQHGIMPRVIQLLFDRARERQCATVFESTEAQHDAETLDDGVEYTFRCSFYQIYNEKITDLLRGTGVPGDVGEATASSLSSSSALTKLKMGARSKRGVGDGDLRVRWHKGDVFKVENLFICTCDSPAEMREMLFSGIRQKVVSSHLLNHRSSRSHCVFTIYVESRARQKGELLNRSELSLVDLAGSEKIGLLSHNPSARLVKESIDINTSLLALGKVITALSSGPAPAAAELKRKNLGLAPRARGGAEQQAATRHIPYRDSKLTMLLKHALGGNSLTTMIACISPSDRYVDETTSTLLYAGRAKNIRNEPHVNEDATTVLIRQLREEIAQLKAELGYYREMAANSLVEREGRVNACECCCGAVYKDPPRSVDPSSLTARGTTEDIAMVQEVDQLADSLVAACGMLTNLMQVNAQLREFYDAVRDRQDAAERREAELNAENLALRERLAVLEDIVLQDEDLGEVKEDNMIGNGDASDADEKLNNSAPGARASKSDKKRGRSRALEETLAVAKESSAAPALGRLADDSACGGKMADSSAEGASSSHRLASSSTAVGQPATATKEDCESNRPVLAPPDNEAVASPVRKIAPGSSTTVKQLSIALRGVPNGSPPFEDATLKGPADRESSRKCAMDDEGRRRLHGHKKRTEKKRNGLANRLKEYEAQYRTPHTIETYADYYKQPARSQSLAAVVPGVPAIRASEAVAPHVTATLQDMKMTVSKLPKAVVREYVPASLLRPGLFGCLAFGGGDSEKALFEQNRSSREARLRALQQRQQELYRQVRLAVHGLRSEDPASGVSPPPSASATSSAASAPQRPNSTSNIPGTAGKREEMISSRSGFAHLSCEPALAYALQAVNRTATGPYHEPSMRQRPRAPSDSMKRLMRYMERDR